MDQLPTEMKQEIFGLLTKKDLISVASTCKNLRSFILNSKCLMEYLNFDLLDFEAQKDYIANYGCGLMRICIGPEDARGRSMKLNQTDMKLMFSSIPNVEEMQINQLIPPASKEIAEDLQLPSLKTLILNNRGNNDKVFNFLHGCQVLELISSMDKIENRSKSFSDDFWNWFNAQTELKSLYLQGYATHNFFNQMDVSDIQIKLKKLNLVCNLNIKASLDFNNFYEFLKQQDEVEEIILENFDDFILLNQPEPYKKVVKQIMLEMEGLKTLKFNGSFTVSDFQEANLKLEKLVLDDIKFKKFYKNFPNIKNLKLMHQDGLDCFEISLYTVLDMKQVSQMNELEKLKIYDYSLIDSLDNINEFQKLKKLTLTACYLRSEDWKLLVDQTPLLEKLKLDMFQLSNDSVLSFINWKKLKQLDMRFGFYQDEIVHVLCHCRAFNHLKISKSTKTQFADQLKDVDFKVETLQEPTDVEYKIRAFYFFQYFRVLIESSYQCNKDDL